MVLGSSVEESPVQLACNVWGDFFFFGTVIMSSSPSINLLLMALASTDDQVSFSYLK